MQATANYIYINDLRIYAYHGVMEQERKVGDYFVINIRIKTDFSQAIHSDNLDGTISYADILSVIKEEMSQPSNLLEHVAGRIAEHLFRSFSPIEAIELKLTKQTPPMGADCNGAGVEIHATR